MTHKEIAVYRQELCCILNTIKDEGERLEALKEFAKKVGAGYVHTTIACSDTIKEGTKTTTTTWQNPISESELVLNINNALQTETMIEVCKTAARNYKIAIAAAIAAVLSALAAWWLIVKMVQ